MHTQAIRFRRHASHFSEAVRGFRHAAATPLMAVTMRLNTPLRHAIFASDIFTPPLQLSIVTFSAFAAGDTPPQPLFHSRHYAMMPAA